MDITISLTSEQSQTILSAFDADRDNQHQEAEACRGFCNVAVALLTDWIAGTKRYRSLTEFNLDAVERLYVALLHDEAPSADRLFNKFNLPSGQAAYLARVLNEKTVPQWRAIGLREARTAIDELFTESKSVSGSDAGDTTVYRDVLRSAARELVVICNTLKRSDHEAFTMPDLAGRLGEYQRIKMSVATLRRIHDHMQQFHLGE